MPRFRVISMENKLLNTKISWPITGRLGVGSRRMGRAGRRRGRQVGSRRMGGAERRRGRQVGSRLRMGAERRVNSWLIRRSSWMNSWRICRRSNWISRRVICWKEKGMEKKRTKVWGGNLLKAKRRRSQNVEPFTVDRQRSVSDSEQAEGEKKERVATTKKTPKIMQFWAFSTQLIFESFSALFHSVHFLIADQLGALNWRV